LKINPKYIFTSIFLLFLTNLYSYEIIRDPVFEDYLNNISIEFNHEEINVYLIKNKTPNAFVFNNSIYFTTGLLEVIDNEDTLKAIYLHEYGHIINNHLQSKKIKIQQSNNKNVLYNLLSVGMAVIVGDVNLGIGTSVTLNSKLISEISQHTVNFEIEADNFMIDQIKKNKINTSELISFLNQVSDKSKNYFRTHPRNEDRINNLKQLNFKKKDNSIKFEWIKSKYSKDSNYETFNIFFKNLEKGIFDQKEKLHKINEELIQYEAFKKGFFVSNWNSEFQNLLSINSNSFLKIEYINYLIDNNYENKYYIIEDLKFDKKLMNEYFYYYIYGKYYNKIVSMTLSNFYFCQFYKIINSKKKSDFFCKKYDIKDIPTLDRSYALFK
tara:strand:+ start:1558 stop:2706 length:1149 start_codon:yes stop_codon:yes gene_type:complete